MFLSLVNRTPRYFNYFLMEGPPQSRVSSPPFFGWEPWPQIQRCLFSSPPLQTAPVWAGGHWLMRPWGPIICKKQTWNPKVTELHTLCHLAVHRYQVHKNRIGVKRLVGVQLQLEMSLIYCWLQEYRDWTFWSNELSMPYTWSAPLRMPQ